MKCHESKTVRLLLRPTGAVLLCLAYATAVHLVILGHGHADDEPPVVYLFALIGFACFSVGGALLFNGHHIFDQIAVSERWARQTSSNEVDRRSAQLEAKRGEAEAEH